MRRPAVLLLFATIFVAEMSWSGVAPLLPDYQELFGLTDTTTGFVLSIAAVGILLVSLPAGALTRLFSVRTLTLWGVGALTVGNLMTGAADSYPVLLAGRCLLGVGLGTMWVTATAWLHDAAGDQSARALALTTTVVGIGSLLGPSLAGVLGERYGLGVPFVVLGVVCGLTGLALAFAPGEAGRVPEPGPPLRDMLRAAFADDLLIASVLLTLIVALMWMTVELLVPLHLDELGYSASKIGLVFSVSAVLFAGSSWIIARRAERHATVRFAAAWSTVFGLGLVFAAIATSASATIVFLCVMGVTTGAMIAITYPLGAVGAKTGGFSVAVVGALLNMVWAGSGILGPGVGGALAGSVGDSVVFVGLAIVGLASAGWMWARARRAVAASSG